MGIIQSWVLIACAALAASCAPTAPQIPFATPVNVSRVISENIAPRPSDCAIETLAAMPSQPYRELGAIEVPGGDLNHRDTLLMIDQNACAMGADAIVVSQAESRSRSGALDVTAIAYAGNLATRAAQAASAPIDSAGSQDESRSPMAQLPQARELPPANPDESSSSSPDSSQPGAGTPPMTEQQIGPADASSPTPEASPSGTPEASPVASPSPTETPTSVASPSPVATPSPSPSSTGTPPPTPRATPSPTPSPIPTAAETRTPFVIATPSSGASTTLTATPSPSSRGGAGAPALPLSLFRIVPDESGNQHEAPDSAGSPESAPVPSAAETTGVSAQSATPSAGPPPSPSTTPSATPSPSLDATP